MTLDDEVVQHPAEAGAGWLCTACAIAFARVSRRTLYRHRGRVETRTVAGLTYWRMRDLAELEAAR